MVWLKNLKQRIRDYLDKRAIEKRRKKLAEQDPFIYK